MVLLGRAVVSGVVDGVPLELDDGRERTAACGRAAFGGSARIPIKRSQLGGVNVIVGVFEPVVVAAESLG